MDKGLSVSLLSAVMLLTVACGPVVVPPQPPQVTLTPTLQTKVTDACPGLLDVKARPLSLQDKADNEAGLPERQIRADLSTFQARIREESNWLVTELEEYAQTIQGKVTDKWQGWIVATGPDALIPMKISETSVMFSTTFDDWEYEPTYPFTDDLSTTLVILDDPHDPGTFRSAHRYDMQPLYLLLTDVQNEQPDIPLCVGQKITFQGKIASAFASFGFLGAVLSDTKARAIEDGVMGSIEAPDLKDMKIKIERSPGWSGPSYRLQVFGNGTLVFEGHGSTEVLGFHITTVRENVLRQLLTEFEKANFFALRDFYPARLTDVPAERISFAISGRSKVVRHDLSNNDAPELLQLGCRIDNILNTRQWVGKAMDGLERICNTNE